MRLRVRVIVSQGAAPPGEGVFIQYPRCLVLAERAQVIAKAISRLRR